MIYMPVTHQERMQVALLTSITYYLDNSGLSNVWNSQIFPKENGKYSVLIDGYAISLFKKTLEIIPKSD